VKNKVSPLICCSLSSNFASCLPKRRNRRRRHFSWSCFFLFLVACLIPIERTKKVGIIGFSFSSSFLFCFACFSAFGWTEETIDRTVGVGSSSWLCWCDGQGVPSSFLLPFFSILRVGCQKEGTVGVVIVVDLASSFLRLLV